MGLKARPKGYLIIDLGMRIVCKAMKSRRAAKWEEWKRIGKEPWGRGCGDEGASEEAAGGEIEEKDVNSSFFACQIPFVFSLVEFFLFLSLFSFFFNSLPLICFVCLWSCPSLLSCLPPSPFPVHSP